MRSRKTTLNLFSISLPEILCLTNSLSGTNYSWTSKLNPISWSFLTIFLLNFNRKFLMSSASLSLRLGKLIWERRKNTRFHRFFISLCLREFGNSLTFAMKTKTVNTYLSQMLRSRYWRRKLERKSLLYISLTPKSNSSISENAKELRNRNELFEASFQPSWKQLLRLSSHV